MIRNHLAFFKEIMEREREREAKVEIEEEGEGEISGVREREGGGRKEEQR